MGVKVDPAALTDSGERCLRRVSELHALGLPPSRFAVVVMAPVEVHVSGVLARLVALSAESDSTFGKALIEHVGEGFFDTWDFRVEWLKKGFGISIAGARPYQDLALVVEARNAMVHGDGQLTARQTGKVPALRALRTDLERRLDIKCRGLVLEPAASSIDKTVEVVRRFVIDFDAAILSAYPSARS